MNRLRHWLATILFDLARAVDVAVIVEYRHRVVGWKIDVNKDGLLQKPVYFDEFYNEP